MNDNTILLKAKLIIYTSTKNKKVSNSFFSASIIVIFTIGQHNIRIDSFSVFGFDDFLNFAWQVVNPYENKRSVDANGNKSW